MVLVETPLLRKNPSPTNEHGLCSFKTAMPKTRSWKGIFCCIPTIYPGGYAYYSRGPQRFHTGANLGRFQVTLLSNRIDWELVNTRVKNNTIWVGNVRYDTIDCLPEHGRTPFGTGRKDQAYESHFRARINGAGNPVPSDVAVPELYNWSLEWCPTIYVI